MPTGVTVVSGDLDFFRPILARVVSRGSNTRFGRTFEDERGVINEDEFRNFVDALMLLMHGCCWCADAANALMLLMLLMR